MLDPYPVAKYSGAEAEGYVWCKAHFADHAGAGGEGVAVRIKTKVRGANTVRVSREISVGVTGHDARCDGVSRLKIKTIGDAAERVVLADGGPGKTIFVKSNVGSSVIATSIGDNAEALVEVVGQAGVP